MTALLPADLTQPRRQLLNDSWGWLPPFLTRPFCNSVKVFHASSFVSMAAHCFQPGPSIPPFYYKFRLPLDSNISFNLSSKSFSILHRRLGRFRIVQSGNEFTLKTRSCEIGPFLIRGSLFWDSPLATFRFRSELSSNSKELPGRYFFTEISPSIAVLCCCVPIYTRTQFGAWITFCKHGRLKPPVALSVARTVGNGQARLTVGIARVHQDLGLRASLGLGVPGLHGHLLMDLYPETGDLETVLLHATTKYGPWKGRGGVNLSKQATQGSDLIAVLEMSFKPVDNLKIGVICKKTVTTFTYVWRLRFTCPYVEGE
jgi:hypothetical protein